MAHQFVCDMSSGTKRRCNAGGKSHENKQYGTFYLKFWDA